MEIKSCGGWSSKVTLNTGDTEVRGRKGKRGSLRELERKRRPREKEVWLREEESWEEG